MAARKIKASWWVDFRFDRARYRKRSPENSRAGALAYEATLRKRLASGEPIDKPQVTVQAQTLKRFAAEWLNSYVVPNNKGKRGKRPGNGIWWCGLARHTRSSATH